MKNYFCPVFEFVLLVGIVTSAAGANTTTRPVVKWHPDPATHVIHAGSALRLYWYWQEPSELPITTRIINGPTSPPCPSALITPERQTLPSTGSLGWYPATAGSYSCTVQYELKNGKVLENATIEIVP